nr:EOG090X02T5 [Macrothrix elegans]
MEHTHRLTNDPQIKWVQQQVVKRRVKRAVLDTIMKDVSNLFQQVNFEHSKTNDYRLNDPNWSLMWYLNRGRGLDMNVQDAWLEGITGKGLTVTILDDGLETNHPDLQRNYDHEASFDFNDNDDDPMPRYDETDSNRHGTRCAGEVAAISNNSICAVGVAFNARIGGVRMLDGDVTDIIEAQSLSLRPQHIDIYSASWGPDDDGKTVDGPGELATRAFIEGVTKGRGGKGSIFVWASGNGGRESDNCNCDGYTNSIWTLSISSATEKGLVPWYSEACAATLASTYSSGAIDDRQIVTTDLHHACTSTHTGTSASAPLAAGICALALEANGNLTWRDMQHIVVRTAKPERLHADDWQVNGAGFKVSHWFGYGLMDAGAMVKLARTWISAPPHRFCQSKGPEANMIHIGPKRQIVVFLNVNDCSGINFMEHVQARINLAAANRGDMVVFLTSPAGTRSNLLARRPHDTSHFGFHSWPFMSVHFWATLEEWNVVIYGTSQPPGVKLEENRTPQQPLASPVLHSEPNKILPKDIFPQPGQPKEQPFRQPVGSMAFGELPVPEALTSNPKDITEDCRVGYWDMEASACLACKDGHYLWNGKCVQECPETTHDRNHTDAIGNNIGVCVPCHYSCLTCQGPADSDCTSCYPDSQLKSALSQTPEDGSQQYCYPKDLLTKLIKYERWFLGIEMALVLNLTVVVSLLIYLCCFKNGCENNPTWSLCCRKSSSIEDNGHLRYRRLRSNDSRDKPSSCDIEQRTETRDESSRNIVTSVCEEDSGIS